MLRTSAADRNRCEKSGAPYNSWAVGQHHVRTTDDIGIGFLHPIEPATVAISSNVPLVKRMACGGSPLPVHSSSSTSQTWALSFALRVARFVAAARCWATRAAAAFVSASAFLAVRSGILAAAALPDALVGSSFTAA